MSESAAHIAADVVLPDDVELAPGAVVYGGVSIGPGCRIGVGAVIHAGSVVGRDCVLEDHVVIGKRARLRAESSAARAEPPAPPVLADGVTICAGAVVYAAARIAAGSIIGDHSQVRERAVIGSRTVVGRGSSVDFDVVIGERVLIQTGVYVTAGSVVEDDVFLGPGVTTTNDHTMGRHARGERLHGPTFRRACRVGGGAVIVPGVEIGEEAFVAAGAVVVSDVPARGVVIGIPGRVVREVPDEDLLERWR